MMKKITLLIILLLSFAGYSQSVLEDFETTLPAGAIVADGTEAPTVVADPAANGTNGDVMKIVTSTAGESWQNSQLFFQEESLDLTTTDKVVTVDVYSDVATFILAKTASGLNGEAESATDASHGGTGWETLTFDFSVPKDNTAAANGVFGRILFFPLWNGAGWDPAAVTTTHYDNVSGLAYNPSSYDVLEDFETTLPAGAIVADGTEAPTVVADPAANGTNGDVMKIVTSTAGESWQNSQLFFQEESLDLTTTDKVVTVDVYSDVATFILAKTASGLNGEAESATDASHGGTGWETLTFDFSVPKDNTAAANGVFGRILFFPLWNGAGWDPAAVTTTHYDNVSGLAYNPSSYDVLEDFETTLPAGAIVADGTEAPTVVADPAANGTNGDVMKIVTSTAGESWQNSQLFFQEESLDLTTTDKVVTVDVYSDVATFILAKTASGLNGEAESATDASHGGTGWETLTFDFSVPKDNTAAANGVFGRILFFPLWNGAGWDPAAVTTTYYDNIKGIGYTGTPPEDPAPTDTPATPPTFNANNVISLYSDAYTAAAGINNVPWDDSAFEEVSIAGNNVLKISGTNFLGIDLDAHLDATNMTHLHMDYWIATDWETGQVLNPKLSNHAAQAGETNALDISNPINSQAEIQNWQSKDFALDGDRESIKQFLITEAGFTDLYYLDNVYLYVEGTAGLEDNNIIDVSVYPNPSNSIWNFRTGNTVITSVEVFNLLGKRVVLQNNNSANVAISTQGLTSGIYIARITTEQGTKSVKLIKE
ncbi:MAG: T9SS type A sorting domain-containing protein [Flavobacteriaceae bacterium]